MSTENVKSMPVYLLMCMVLLLQAGGCRTGTEVSADTVPVPAITPSERTATADCDPPPPCLPVREQPVLLGVRLPAKAAIQPLPGQASVRVAVNQLPGGQQVMELYWEDPGEATPATLPLLLTGPGRTDTLRLTFRQEILDCCPRLVVAAVRRNNRLLCEDCPARQPVDLGGGGGGG